MFSVTGSVILLTSRMPSAIPEKEMNKIAGSRVVVINALRKKKHYSHFNLSEAVAILEKLKPEQGFLTHVSHQMGCYEDVKKELPAFISQAYDGLRVEALNRVTKSQSHRVTKNKTHQFTRSPVRQFI